MPIAETFSPVRPRMRWGMRFLVSANAGSPKLALIMVAAATSRNRRLVVIGLTSLRAVSLRTFAKVCSAQRQLADPFSGGREDCVTQRRNERRKPRFSHPCGWGGWGVAV